MRQGLGSKFSQSLLSCVWSDTDVHLLFPLQNRQALWWHGAHRPRQPQAALFHRQRWANVQIYLEFFKNIKTPHSWWFQGEISRDLDVLYVPWWNKSLTYSQNRAPDGGYFWNMVFDFRYLAKVSMGLLQWHLSGFPKVASILHFPLLAIVWWSNLAAFDPGKLNIAGWWWNQRMLPSATNRSWALLVTCPVILFYHSLLIAATPPSTHMLKFREPCGNHGIDKINSTRGNIWALSHRRIFTSPDSWMHNGNLVLHF